MILPIIVSCDGDVQIYDSLAQAQKAIEPMDVYTNMVQAYDSQGKKISLRLNKEKFVWRVEVMQQEENSIEELELRNILLHYLISLGKPVGKTQTLAQLIDLCRPYTSG